MEAYTWFADVNDFNTLDHQTEVGPAWVCFLNVLNNSLVNLHSLVATTLSTARVRPMVVGLSGPKRPHWVSNCYYRMARRAWMIDSHFQMRHFGTLSLRVRIPLPEISFDLTTILHLGFQENSTLIDIFTLNQGRQSALTTNVSDSFWTKDPCSPHHLTI